MPMVSHGIVTNECHVAEGETKSVDDFDYTFADYDWLKKTGKGTLKAIDNPTTKINLLIEEGVYLVPAGYSQCGGATLIVRRGASFNSVLTKKDCFVGDWQIYLAGEGTGEGDNLGALSIGGSLTDASFGLSSKFILNSDDATIYTYGTMNTVFSGASAEWGPTLNMNRRTLTLRGKDANAVFRPRWKLSVEQPGPIVVQNGQFARHDTVNNINGVIPVIRVIENGKLAAYSNGKIWSNVSAFDFEYGSIFANGNGSPTEATLTMTNLIGAATITDTVLTISEGLVARGNDLVEEHYLNVSKALTIGDGCIFSITNWENMAMTPDNSYVVAHSDTSITGTPALDEITGKLFTIENTGNELVVTPKSNNVLLKLAEGEENAAANTAVIASMTLADEGICHFPAGEYYFSDKTIDLSAMTAKNVVIFHSGDKACVLHAAIKLGAAENLLVKNLTFCGLETPAIVAEGTSGLTVESCTLTAVKGTYGEAGAFPYALLGVTDFRLVNPFYTIDEDGDESTLWDGQAYFDGGTQTMDSVARAGEIVFDVKKGMVVDDWWFIADIYPRVHLKDTAFSGKILRKRNDAALDMEGSINLSTLGVTKLEIDEGQFVARENADIGIDNSPVHVSPGGTFSLYGKMKDRKVSFSGAGMSPEYPAVRFTGTAQWDKAESMDWTLEGDAVMYNNSSGENGTFLRSVMRMNGHTLTLAGISTANYRIGRSCDWYDGGTLIVDGVALSITSRDTDSSQYKIYSGEKPRFIFKNKAKFIPDSNDFTTMIKDVDFADGTSITLKSGVSGFDIAFDSLTGNPTIDPKFTKLEIREKYAARVEDFTAGRAFELAETTPLVFADDVTVSLVADKLEKPTAEYTLIRAPGGITGAKPKLDPVAREAGWRLLMNSARTELQIGRRLFYAIICR